MNTVHIPTITDSFLLATVATKFPPASKTSEQAKRAAIKDMIAKGVTAEQAEKQVHARIDLFPDGELKACKTPFYAFDTYFRRMSVGWLGGRGTRLVSVHKVEQVEAKYMEAKLAFIQAVTAFKSSYVRTLAKLERDGGQYFDASLYPSPTDLDRYFEFNVTFQPIADPSAFEHGGLSQSQAEQLKQRLTDALDNAAKDATDEYRDKVREALQHAASKLQGGKGTRLFDSVLTTLTDLVDADLNVTKDAALADALNDIKTSVQPAVKDALVTRESCDKARAAELAEKAAKKLAGL